MIVDCGCPLIAMDSLETTGMFYVTDRLKATFPDLRGTGERLLRQISYCVSDDKDFL